MTKGSLTRTLLVPVLAVIVLISAFRLFTIHTHLHSITIRDAHDRAKFLAELMVAYETAKIPQAQKQALLDSLMQDSRIAWVLTLDNEKNPSKDEVNDPHKQSTEERLRDWQKRGIPDGESRSELYDGHYYYFLPIKDKTIGVVLYLQEQLAQQNRQIFLQGLVTILTVIMVTRRAIRANASMQCLIMKSAKWPKASTA
jgi:hypothetical protein